MIDSFGYYESSSIKASYLLTKSDGKSMSVERELRVLDIFCGVGGLSWGFQELGFKVAGGIDIWEEAIKVFSAVHQGCLILVSDMRTVDDWALRKVYGEIDVVVGGPPCQAFSTAGKRALDDERAYLVKEFLRIVKVLNPRVVVFENVRGFTSFAKGLLLREFLEELCELGYETEYDVVSATEYAVPQTRERFILIGALGRKPHLLRRLSRKVWTVREALSDLPHVEAGQSVQEYASEPQNDLQRFYRRSSPRRLTLHTAKTYGRKLMELIKYVPEGLSAHDIIDRIPPELRPTSGFKNTYARMRYNQPSPTITRNFQVVSSHRCIHPEANRGLTPREAARLQSFPDDYPLELLKNGELALAIGSAVPPLMSLAVAYSVGLTLGFKPALPLEVKKLWKSLEKVEDSESSDANQRLRSWQLELYAYRKSS